jgi:hypothetical protein
MATIVLRLGRYKHVVALPQDLLSTLFVSAAVEALDVILKQFNEHEAAVTDQLLVWITFKPATDAGMSCEGCRVALSTHSGFGQNHFGHN